MILQRSGGSSPEQLFQEWDNALGVARAFRIGKLESESVSNLMSKVNKTLLSALDTAVRKRGMARFLSHELIARGAFNQAWSARREL